MAFDVLKKGILAFALGALAVFLARTFTTPKPVERVIPLTQSEPIAIYLQADEKNNIEVFREVSQSVVYISSVQYQRDFFSLNVYEIPQGTGTGFVWDDKGHIVTNFHVIDDANRVEVTLWNQKTYNAEFIGGDPDKDLAVLKIDAKKSVLNPIKTVGREPLLVGQKAIAIGNPFGLDNTMTVGIISALGREIESLTGRKITGVIQTDAAINPGNSGGPLLNTHGKMIGVNTQIVSKSGSSSGIGFAIPIDVVKKIIPQLIQYGKVREIGLAGVSLVPDYYRYRLGFKSGVIIYKVRRGSSAERVGLKGLSRGRFGRIIVGDVVVELEGKEIAKINDIADILDNYKSGQSVDLKVFRDDRLINVKVKLEVKE
jgi:S1-C subfamily serine protease